MTKQDVLLIHGTWCNGGNWGDFATEMTERGFRVHAPSYRHHGSPRDVGVWANAQEIAKLGLHDYVADLEALVRDMETPPIIIGHSLGALVAQLLGARVKNRGLVLLGPAPTAGMWFFSPSMLTLWARYLPHWVAGKPMYPVSKKAWDKYVCNTLPSEFGDPYYDSLCAESGTAYREMVLWFLDPKRRARVDFAAVDAPVLVITGSQDKCTIPRIGRITARRYRDQGTYVELDGSDHMMTVGPYLPATLAAIDGWIESVGARLEQAERRPAVSSAQ